MEDRKAKAREFLNSIYENVADKKDMQEVTEAVDRAWDGFIAKNAEGDNDENIRLKKLMEDTPEKTVSNFLKAFIMYGSFLGDLASDESEGFLKSEEFWKEEINHVPLLNVLFSALADDLLKGKSDISVEELESLMEKLQQD